MPLCCARAIMAMSVALVFGLVPSVAHAAAMGTTTGLAVQAINTSVSQASQSQLSASEDGDALFRPLPSNTGTASVSRKRKADGKHPASFRSMLKGCVSFAARSLSVFYCLTNLSSSLV